jgi:hypothetical protein
VREFPDRFGDTLPPEEHSLVFRRQRAVATALETERRLFARNVKKGPKLRKIFLQWTHQMLKNSPRYEPTQVTGGKRFPLFLGAGN